MYFDSNDDCIMCVKCFNDNEHCIALANMINLLNRGHLNKNGNKSL